MRNDAQRTVLTTLALADAFGWALTGFEVWRYTLEESGGLTPLAPRGSNPPALRSTLTALDELVAEGTLAEQDGHYVFPGREALVTERLWRSQLVGQKRRKANRWAKWLVKLPYVEGVFAYGSLATGHTSKKSDLDVLVVLRDERIFTGRLLTSLFLETFGARRTAKRIENQICLNHFVIERALEFPKEYRSPFSAWLWARMFPLAVTDPSLPDRFYEANKWVADYFPNIRRDPRRTTNDQRPERSEGGTVPSEARGGLSPRGTHRSLDWLERWLGRMQLRRIERHPLTKKGGGRVVANDRMMIFHPGLPEERVLQRFSNRLSGLAKRSEM